MILAGLCLAGEMSSYKCERCNDKLKIRRGCEKEYIVKNKKGELVPAPIYRHHLLPDGPLYRCPISQIDKLGREAMLLYLFYEDGFLPDGGGIYDQSAIYLESMRILKNIVTTVQSERMEDQRNARRK